MYISSSDSESDRPKPKSNPDSAIDSPLQEMMNKIQKINDDLKKDKGEK